MAHAVAAKEAESLFKELRDEVDISRPVFCRLLSVSERTLADLETKKKEPGDAVLRKYHELKRLIDALKETIEPNYLRQWLLKPNAAFDGLKPIEVIERGEIDRIWRMIYFIRSGDAY